MSHLSMTNRKIVKKTEARRKKTGIILYFFWDYRLNRPSFIRFFLNFYFERSNSAAVVWRTVRVVPSPINSRDRLQQPLNWNPQV